VNGAVTSWRRAFAADPNWYRIGYALAVEWLHAASKEAAKADRTAKEDVAADDGDALAKLLGSYRDTRLIDESRDARLENAESTAAGLARQAAVTLDRHGWHWPMRRPGGVWRLWYHRRPAIDPNLAEFLDRVVGPGAAIVVGSARVERGKLDWATLQRAEPFADRWRLRIGALDNADLARYLAYLAADHDTRLRRRVAGALRAKWRNPRGASYRVRYNLACLYSRLIGRDGGAAAAAASATQLERSFDDVPPGPRHRQLVTKAWADPGLDALRKRDRSGFRKIVGDPPEDLVLGVPDKVRAAAPTPTPTPAPTPTPTPRAAEGPMRRLRAWLEETLRSD
jgi:hypothetical protein